MNRARIEIGDKVFLDINIKDDLEDVNNILILKSVIVAIDDEFILIQMPIHQGRYYSMPPNEAVVMRIITDIVPYTLDVLFEEQIKKNGIIMAKMRRLSQMKESQQRDSFRCRCSLPLIIERLELPESGRAEGRMIDLSDGGALFATNESIDNHEKIEITFNIGTKQIIECIVLRVENINLHIRKYDFKVGVQFLKMSRNQKDQIYRYILTEQRKHLRRNR